MDVMLIRAVACPSEIRSLGGRGFPLLWQQLFRDFNAEGRELPRGLRIDSHDSGKAGEDARNRAHRPGLKCHKAVRTDSFRNRTRRGGHGRRIQCHAARGVVPSF
jgi:hypothetical protein